MEAPNLNYVRALSGGDKLFENKLITIIKREFKEEKEIYCNNFIQGKYALASENVHKLKHKISILGLEKSYEIAGEYENNILEDDLSLSKEFDSILENITNFLTLI